MARIIVFCAHCGAANEADATACFACGREPGKPESAARETGERLVKKRYRPVRQVGTGGFGAVYLAEDMLAGKKQVALKEIRLAGLSSQEMIEATDAFNREVSLLPGLRHGHLPRVYDHFTDAQHWYVIMEFIAGETLESYVQKVPGGRLPVEVALDMGIQLADVLDYLHSRQPPIIFRDLKPANIMRTPTGHLYLIDFGIARIFKPGQPKDTIAFGSPGYAPPEQYGKAQTTARSDLYSLGATLHFLLSGDDPANTPFSFAPFAPSLAVQPGMASLQRLIMQMVELDAAKRPQSAQAVKRELQEIATQLLQERLRSLHPIDRPSSSFIQPYIPSSQMGGQGQIQVGRGAQKAAPKRGQTRRLFIRVAAGAILTTIAAGSIAQLLGSLELRPAPTMDSPAQPTRFAFGNGPVGKTYYTYTDPDGGITGVAWSPDGKYIVAGGYSQVAQVLQAADGESTGVHAMNGGPIRAVAWSGDGNYIASANETVQVWHPPAFYSAFNITYTGHHAPVNAVTWSPDNQYIASASDDGTVQIWHALTGKQVNTYRGHREAVKAVAWSPDSQFIASGDAKGEVHIWKPFQVGDAVRVDKGHSAQVNGVAWSAADYGYYIASASADGTVRVWNALAGVTQTVYKGHHGAVRAVAWMPGEMQLASAGDDGSVRLWDALGGDEYFVYRQNGQPVVALSWSPNGMMIASGSLDGTMQVWQAG